MSKSAPSYTSGAIKGLNNKTLQNSLKKLQNSFGKGALKYWQFMPDSDLRKRVKAQRMQTLEHADIVLAELADKIRSHGGHVYFATTAKEAVDYTLTVAKKNNVRSVVKGKSMTSAEVGVDPALEKAGIEVIETDLGEYIIQLAGDAPSHIIAPCIHMDRKQIGSLFSEKLDIVYTDDPPTLTKTARVKLREKLLSADMGLTGCNIACAETGHVSLVSNEGNIRMATTIPKVHVAYMGLERVAATLEEHQSLLQLLTKGAALQKLSTYVSFTGGPSPEGDPDGPEEFHLVVIDNGRSKILGDPEFREILACIRCGACLNICPVYGKIGGHAYNSPYCGPIGAVITPLLGGINKHADLCKGETLCGACKDVCPVENDLPRMLSALRHKLAYGDKKWEVKIHKPFERMSFRFWKHIISNRKVYDFFLKMIRGLQNIFIRPNPMITKLLGPGGKWTKDRNIPALPPQSFSELWRKKYKNSTTEKTS